VEALKQRSAARIVVAVPIAPPEACTELQGDVDDVVCARTPGHFRAVGAWYEDFEQISDDDVRQLLTRACAEAGTAGAR
jgi:putative phosphoribosyl transferase